MLNYIIMISGLFALLFLVLLLRSNSKQKKLIKRELESVKELQKQEGITHLKPVKLDDKNMLDEEKV